VSAEDQPEEPRRTQPRSVRMKAERVSDEPITRVRQIEAALEVFNQLEGQPRSVSLSGPPWHMPDDDPRLLRKQRSEAILAEERIQFSKHMPPIEGADEVTLRPLSEVHQRVAILYCMSLFARGNTDDRWPTLEQLSAIGAMEAASPFEREFLEGARDFDEQETTNAWWLLDAAAQLLWALGADVFLEWFPKDGTSLAKVGKAMPPPTQLAEVYPQLIDLDEILDRTDLTYRLHWASKPNRDGSLRCTWLSHSALMERHKALNWLIGYRGYATWDEVTTDT